MILARQNYPHRAFNELCYDNMGRKLNEIKRYVHNFRETALN